MNAKALLPLALILALGLGWFARGFVEPRSGPPAGPGSDSPCPGGAIPLYWKAPMDPTFIRDEPGKSPMGMDLVPECPAPDGREKAGVVRIDPAVVQNLGVRTALVETRDLQRFVRAVGRVATDERRVSHVHTKVQGFVERLLVDYVGQEVERGQPLLEIYSPQLVSTQEELLLAARYRDQTQESPFPDVSEGGQELFRATRRRMQLWDIPERDVARLLRTGQIQKTLTLYAPTTGVVTELGVRAGMEVAPNQNLYTIADLSSVWVLADVYEFELPWIEVGQRGRVELSYLPGVEFSGSVSYIAPFLDPKTRTVQVRLELPNPEGRLKPEMFGNVTLEGSPRRAVTAIPTEAVMRSGRRALVAVALGEGRFAIREIGTGLEGGEGWVEVTRGLEPGERVVISSQFLIDSESRLQEAAQRLLDSPSGGAEAPGKRPGRPWHEMPERTGDHEERGAPRGSSGHVSDEMPAAPGRPSAPHGDHSMHGEQ